MNKKEKKNLIEKILTLIIQKICNRIAPLFSSYVPNTEECIFFIEETVNEMYYSILKEDLEKDFESDPEVNNFPNPILVDEINQKRLIEEKYLKFYEARFFFYCSDWKKWIKGEIFTLGPRMF